MEYKNLSERLKLGMWVKRKTSFFHPLCLCFPFFLKPVQGDTFAVYSFVRTISSFGGKKLPLERH